MRENTKMVSVSVGGEKREFRITKLDAFSGVALLRMLEKKVDDPELRNYADLFLSLQEEEMTKVMRTCLGRAEISLPAGFARVWTQECWGLPELEYDTMACLALTLEVMSFTMNGFFPAKGSPSGPGAEDTCR